MVKSHLIGSLLIHSAVTLRVYEAFDVGLSKAVVLESMFKAVKNTELLSGLQSERCPRIVHCVYCHADAGWSQEQTK